MPRTTSTWASEVRARNAAAQRTIAKRKARLAWSERCAANAGLDAQQQLDAAKFGRWWTMTERRYRAIYDRVREAAHWGRIALEQDHLTGDA